MTHQKYNFRSVRNLTNQFEKMLSTVVDYAQGAEDHRLPRLINAVRDFFHCDVCLVAPRLALLHNQNYVTGCDGFSVGDIENRFRDSLIWQWDGRNDVLLLNSKADGGPAVMAKGEIGEILMFRLNRQRYFTAQDTQLLKILWRNCGRVDSCRKGSKSIQPIEDPNLAPRSRQVLDCLLAGLAEKEIAERLSISRHTVHIHVKNLYRRFEVNSRSQLMVRCLKQGSESELLPPSIIQRDGGGRPGLKFVQRQVKPANQVVPPACPVYPVGGSEANMLFS